MSGVVEHVHEARHAFNRVWLKLVTLRDVMPESDERTRLCEAIGMLTVAIDTHTPQVEVTVCAGTPGTPCEKPASGPCLRCGVPGV